MSIKFLVLEGGGVVFWVLGGGGGGGADFIFMGARIFLKSAVDVKLSHRVLYFKVGLCLGVPYQFLRSSVEIPQNQKGLEVCYCLLGGAIQTLAWVLSWARPGPSRVRGGPVQIRHVLCFTVFRTHPGREVGAIPARPGPILLPSVPYRIGPGRAETDFLATSHRKRGLSISNYSWPREANYRSTAWRLDCLPQARGFRTAKITID